MEYQINCPHCQAHLKSRNPLPRGKAIQCRKCLGRFTVRQVDESTLISAPFQAPPPSFSARGLGVALAALLFLLVAGTGLAVYCFALPADDAQVQVRDEDDQQAPVEAETVFTARIEDEPDEGVVIPARYRIEDQPEERTAEAAPAPVKVDIKDLPLDTGPHQAPIDQTPLVKYALRTPPGAPPPPELRDSHTATGVENWPLTTVPSPSRPLAFGMSTTAAAGPARNKLLTWAADGSSNTTVVRIDAVPAELGGVMGPFMSRDSFGRPVLHPGLSGRLVRSAVTHLTEGVEVTPGAVSPSQSTWAVHTAGDGSGGLRIHQVLEVVPGQATPGAGIPRRRLDTVLVRWLIDNQDHKAHKFGLRLQLDTLIGSNDGVPFTVPGHTGLIGTWADFRRAKDVPDFIQALEVPDLRNPGTIAQLTAKVGGKIEPPERLSLTWQKYWRLGFDPVRNWDFPIRNMETDSAVILYWSDKILKPGTKRLIGFAYGLGEIASTDTLGVTLGGSFEPGQSFTVTAYVEKPQPGQTLRLELPEGLHRTEGDETQPVAQNAKTSIVTWKVGVERTGAFRLTVRSSTGLSQPKTIVIARPSLEREGEGQGKFTFDLSGKFDPGRTFEVTARVIEPVPGQALTLQLPAGLERVAGQEVQRVLGAGREKAGPKVTDRPEERREADTDRRAAAGNTVHWSVRVLRPGTFPVRVVSSTGIAQSKTLTIVQPVAATANFRVALSGDFKPGNDFTVSARVTKPASGQTLTLQLPAGLERTDGDAVQKVPAGIDADVSWKVGIQKTGAFPIRVASSTGIIQTKNLIVATPGQQQGTFTFELTGDIGLNKEFEVKARVAKPLPDQTLTLKLPNELELTGGTASQPVGPAGSLSWRVRVVAAGRFPVRLESSTGLVRTKTIILRKKQQQGLFGS